MRNVLIEVYDRGRLVRIHTVANMNVARVYVQMCEAEGLYCLLMYPGHHRVAA